MSESSVARWPQHYARLCGVFYLYIIVAGIFAELFVRTKLVIPADAGATARNILAHESLFRLGFSGEILHLSFDVMVAVILYALLRRVDRSIALLAAFMRLACDLILAVASMSHFAALKLLHGGSSLEAFSAEQLHSLALWVMNLHADAYAISLVFFGFACLALGHLLYHSGFLPKLLGLLLALAGLCYLFTSFAQFLDPPFAQTLFPVFFIPCFVGELAFAFWMLLKGVDLAKWRERTLGLD